MFRGLIMVVLTLAALTATGLWVYNACPYVPYKLTFWSESTRPGTPTIRFYGPRSEWYVAGGRFMVQHSFLVDKSRRCTNGWTLGPFYFKLDVYLPYVCERPYQFSGMRPLERTSPTDQQETTRLMQFNLACLNVQVPLWFLVGLFGFYPLVVILRRPARRRRRRRMRGLCVNCAYDLTGNVSGICPECGTEIKKP